MAAKTSPEMIKAREMIERGATPYRAAKDCGLTISGITRSKWYREFVSNKSAETPEATPMMRARVLVESGRTAYEASKLTGVAQSSISRSAWYRSYKAKQEGATCKN